MAWGEIRISEIASKIGSDHYGGRIVRPNAKKVKDSQMKVTIEKFTEPPKGLTQGVWRRGRLVPGGLGPKRKKK